MFSFTRWKHERRLPVTEMRFPVVMSSETAISVNQRLPDPHPNQVVGDEGSNATSLFGRLWADHASKFFAILAPIALLAVLIACWQIAADRSGVTASVLPSPLRVVRSGWAARELIWLNTVPTLQETVIGLLVSIVVSVTIASVLSFVPWLRSATLPLLIAAQSVPIIVLAPLFVIWFGFGLGPKIALIVIVTALPLTIAMLQGLLSADPDSAKLMKTLGASEVKIFLRLRVPTSLPFFFTGLRVVTSFAVVAAIFSEFVGAESGLGIFMQTQKNLLRTDLVFAAVIVSIVISLLLFAATYALEAMAMPWERRRKAMRKE